MKMPENVRLTPRDIRDMPSSGVVRFETACGSVSGSAYRKGGWDETHYDIMDAKRLTQPPGDRGSARPSMVESKVGIGSFNVVGQVTFIFDDGVFTVEAHGFDFWVDPDQIDKPVQLGDWVQLDVRNLTLYVGGGDGYVPVSPPVVSCVRISCEGCGAGISVPELPEALRSRLAELVRSEGLSAQSESFV